MPNRSAVSESRVGAYQYLAGNETWQWSDGIYAIHGFRRGDVVPTTALLLAHAHAADRGQAARMLAECLCTGELFSFPYRMIDTAGSLHWALIAGEGMFDAAGTVTGVRGYLVDLTEPPARARSREAGSTLRRAVASQARIEQAKGALMLVYGLDAEAAFALLSWQSQHSNIKLRELADRLVNAVGRDGVASTAVRRRLDEMIYHLPGTPAPAGPADPGAPGGQPACCGP